MAVHGAARAQGRASQNRLWCMGEIVGEDKKPASKVGLSEPFVTELLTNVYPN